MSNAAKHSQRRYMQYASALSASISSASFSSHFVWTSPTLPILLSDNSPLNEPITDEEASWLVSSLLLASFVGAAVGGWLTEKIGRKLPLIISSIFMFVPWILIIFAKHVYILILARIIGGIGCGMSIIGCAIYNTEIADNDIRGKLGATFIALKLIGSIVVLTIGPYVSYTNLSIICALFPIVFFGAFVFMPESPYYLMKIGDINNAKKSLRTLASSAVDGGGIDKRAEQLRSMVECDMMNKTTVWKFLTNEQYRKPIIIMAGIKTLQQFSGSLAIESYMQSIIEMSDSIISPEHSSVIFAIGQVVGVLIASFLVDKIGRKPLMVFSALGCSVGLFGEGLYFYIQDITTNSTANIKWLPTTGITVFMIMSAIGIMGIPYILVGELFPTNIKGIAVSITIMYGTMLGFAVSKTFDPISRALGMHSIFWLYAANCVVGAIFVIFLLPETKGETFSDIQDKVKYKGQKGIYYFVT